MNNDPLESAKQELAEAVDLIPDHMREDVVDEILDALRAADELAASLLENQDMEALNPIVLVPPMIYIGRTIAIRNSLARGVQFLSGNGVDLKSLIRQMKEEEKKQGKDR